MSSPSGIDLSNVEKAKLLVENIKKTIKGKDTEIMKIVTTLIAGGHILIEDNPGSGKTMTAKTLAFSIADRNSEFIIDNYMPGNKGKTGKNKHVVFKRIQFTPDLLPMDLIGIHIFDDSRKDFVFKKGPLFANIIVADEINRASPKVQSALLECMAENQVTIGETTYRLDDLFFVIATQNPIEIEGTYPLPAAQLDRFFMKINFGYVSDEVELNIYENYGEINSIDKNIKPVLLYEDLVTLQKEAGKVYVHPEIMNGVRNIVTLTRKHPQIELGASTRSGIIFLKCLRAYALINNRSYVIENDIQDIGKEVLLHRLIFKNRDAEQNVLNSIIETEMDRLTRLKLETAS